MQEASNPGVKKRGNGQGSIVPLDDGRWRAQIIVDTYSVVNASGKLVLRKKTKSRICGTKREANAAISELWREHEEEKNGGRPVGVTPTFRELFDQWDTYYEPLVVPSTMTCYRSAMKYLLTDLGTMRVSDIGIDDLQASLDAIPHGRRTKENAKAACGLI